MLSAVAARKTLAVQAQASVTNASPLSEPNTESDESEEDEIRLSAKRKSPEHQRVGDRRKRKKAKRGPSVKASRYFSELQGLWRKNMDDVVESDGMSDSTQDAGSGDASEAEDLDFVLSEGRPWSPSVPLHDSSDDKTPEETTSSPTHRFLTTFKPLLNQNIFSLSQGLLSELNLTSAPGSLLVLSMGETICVAGTYQLTVLQGTVSLLGTKVGASMKVHHVYAPKSSPLPVIKMLSYESSILNPESSRRLGLGDSASGAVLLIQELRTGVQGLGRVCKNFSGAFDFARDEARQWGQRVLGVAGAYVLRKPERHYEPFSPPESWSTAVDGLSLPSTGGVYFVKGPRKTGKSTLARMLLNHLLSRFERVAYLECDPGQSEFTPGGMVALNVVQDYCFGPPFTHPTMPNAAHYIGSTTPRSSPKHYLESIQALFRTYELAIRNPFLPYASRTVTPGENHLSTLRSDNVPLVVNTMGWNKGLGATLTQKIEDIVQPTHIFEFCLPDSAVDNYNDVNNSGLGLGSKSQFYIKFDPIIPSPTSPLHAQYAPADHRVIGILSYLHATFPPLSPEPTGLPAVSLEQLSATSWRTALPLCSQPPYAVDWRTALDRITLIGSGAEDIIPAEVGNVLNGALVGIVSNWADDGTISTVTSVTNGQNQPLEQELSTQLPYVQGAAPPAPASSTCLGLALIRSVSFCSPLAVPSIMVEAEKELHVLTPVPLTLLKRGRIFVKGELELPVWGMLDYSGASGDGWKKGVAGMEWGRVPYLKWGKGEGIGADRRRVRRNLMRKAQM